jgi:hypothetical protein
MGRLAVYTIGVLKEAWGHPSLSGFGPLSLDIFRTARGAEGFLELREDIISLPRWVAKEDRSKALSTLSVWRSLEDLYAFAYWGDHGTGYQRRRDWFTEVKYPIFVLWWMTDGEQLDDAEAVRRIEFLHEHGPTPTAFTLKVPFSPSGERLESVAAMRRKSRTTSNGG